MKLNFEEINQGSGTVITLGVDSLDAANAKDFKERLQPLLDTRKAVLIDMSSLTFVDSSGLGALLSCLRTMNGRDCQLKLFAMTKPVLALFELVRMHRIFSIYNTKEEALAAI